MKYVKAVLNNNNVVNGEMVGLKDNVIILNNATEYYNGKLFHIILLQNQWKSYYEVAQLLSL